MRLQSMLLSHGALAMNLQRVDTLKGTANRRFGSWLTAPAGTIDWCAATKPLRNGCVASIQTAAVANVICGACTSVACFRVCQGAVVVLTVEWSAVLFVRPDRCGRFIEWLSMG